VLIIQLAKAGAVFETLWIEGYWVQRTSSTAKKQPQHRIFWEACVRRSIGRHRISMTSNSGNSAVLCQKYPTESSPLFWPLPYSYAAASSVTGAWRSDHSRPEASSAAHIRQNCNVGAQVFEWSCTTTSRRQMPLIGWYEAVLTYDFITLTFDL